ncbi:MAG: hypothetical protein ACTSQ8_25405 [Candidatus Helarchaeota archaeon]
MDEKRQMKKLKKLISDYLKEYTLNPAMKSIEENVFIAYKLGNILVTLRASEQSMGQIGFEFKPLQKSDINKNDIEKLKNIAKGNECSKCDIDFLKHITSKMCSKRCLLPYLDRQLNWIVISIISCSYLSSIIEMRSIFELLMNVSTKSNGSMSEKIDAISFFNLSEKKKIKKIWKELCSWSHPYGKWLKNMCPIYVSHKPIYHPKHFEDCINMLEKVFDIYLVICKRHFKMDVSIFRNIDNEDLFDLSDFPLFQKRIKR